MPRKAHLEPHLTAAELKDRYQHCREPVESRRWHLLWLVSQKWQIKEAAVAVGLNYDYAREIVKAYNQQGTSSLANRRKQPGHRGRRPLLNREQLGQLQQALRQPPADGGVWSGPKVARWMAQQTGVVSVRAQRGWDYLKGCRFPPQHPRPRHTQANAQVQADFKANLGDGKDPVEKGPFGVFSPLLMAEPPILLLSLLSFALENAITKSPAK